LSLKRGYYKITHSSLHSPPSAAPSLLLHRQRRHLRSSTVSCRLRRFTVPTVSAVITIFPAPALPPHLQLSPLPISGSFPFIGITHSNHNLFHSSNQEQKETELILPKMFYLSEIEHTLRLPPHLLDLPLHDAIKGELEGSSMVALSFLEMVLQPTRLIMFRPFVGEVIVAKLKESDSNVSLGFFDDIYVPVHLMPNPSHSEPDPENKEQIRWIWEFGEENYPIDGIDEIRFRVQSINYPSIPVEQEKEKNQDEREKEKQAKPDEREKEKEKDKQKQGIPDEREKQKQKKSIPKPFAPMLITGSLDADGLGPISWWI
ncbi:hypothetical protein HYC85_024953, partial [Camellia sinensis]